jgi:hypothetical protein
MANEMIKFYKGLEASLPATGENGSFYITTDEGGIYLGTGTGMKRLGDFVQVSNVASLPAKAHENCLYYCVAENILAKWNGTEWKQINKQPTAEELKGLLGLGSMAYVSTVVESHLSTELAEKINASAEGNHAHSNKGVLDGITADKVAAWDSAEQNAKTHADTEIAKDRERLNALELIDHTHDNKTLLDSYTQTESDLADAVSKKHSHSFNETELNKIVEGDVAKWNGVAADHLTSADKTTLEDAIKEAKKAGTDANTALEAYKVTNDAAIDAIEEDIAEITNAENGILATAKSYSDGKLATARTEISAEIDADVKAVADDLAGYKTSNDSALAGVKATAEAAATKAYTDEELGKKVDKVEGKSLVSDSEITKLAGVSQGANKVEASTTNGNIKIDGVETTVYTHPAKHVIGDVTGLQDALNAKVAQSAYDEDKATFATKTELGNVDAKFANYTTTTAQQVIDAEQDRRLGVIEGDYIKSADIADFETKENVQKVADDLAELTTFVGTIPTDEKYADVDSVIEYVNKKAEETLAAASGNSTETAASVKAALETYEAANNARVETAEKAIDAIEADYLKAADKTELSGLITAEKERAEGIEGGLRADVDTIKGDYLKKADKDGLQEQITANANAITLLTDGVSADEVDGVKDLIQYVKDHGPEVTAMQEDIGENADAIATINNETTGILAQAKSYADGKDTAMNARVEALEAIDHTHSFVESELNLIKAGDVAKWNGAQAAAEATAAAALATARTEITAEIDADVKALADGAVKTNADAIAIINGAETQNGSIAKALKDAKDYADAAEADAITAANAYTDSALQWGSF